MNVETNIRFTFVMCIVPNNPDETVLKSNNKQNETNFTTILNKYNLI